MKQRKEIFGKKFHSEFSSKNDTRTKNITMSNDVAAESNEVVRSDANSEDTQVSSFYLHWKTYKSEFIISRVFSVVLKTN